MACSFGLSFLPLFFFRSSSLAFFSAFFCFFFSSSFSIAKRDIKKSTCSGGNIQVLRKGKSQIGLRWDIYPILIIHGAHMANIEICPVALDRQTTSSLLLSSHLLSELIVSKISQRCPGRVHNLQVKVALLGCIG